MYQPEIHNVEDYLTSPGRVPVHRAKLFIQKVRSDDFQEGDIVRKYFAQGTEIGMEAYALRPFIVSTEDIEDGDLVMDTRNYALIQCDETEESLNESPFYMKFLAGAKRLSPKTAEKIGTDLKTGQDVLVKCAKEVMDEVDGIYSEEYYLDFDENGHITVFDARQSLEDAAKEYTANEHPRSYDTQMRTDTYGEDQIRRAFNAGAVWAMQQEKVANCFVGVGDGTGELFVHGSYPAVKRVQEIILEWEKLK